MRVANFDRVEPSVLKEIPCRLIQSSSQARAATLICLYLPVVVAFAVAPVVVFLHVVLTPSVQDVLTDRPLLATELLTGFAFWLFLLGLPLKRLVERLSVRRLVQFDDGTVTVSDQVGPNISSWSAPLASYEGLTHHVRASLSGTRHELILVHRNRKKSILVCLSDRITQRDIDRIAVLFGCEEIPPRELYRIRAFFPDLPKPTWWRPAHA